jgi:streptomycin 6-kinase
VNIVPTGSEALVVEVTTADGREGVLKLGIPGLDSARDEPRVLLAGQGRGYAEVWRHDKARQAILLERLGPQLHELGWPVESQIEAICAVLREAWTCPTPEGPPLTTGAEKARRLAGLIERSWSRLGEPCGAATVDLALRFAERRARDFDPGAAVVAHGDAHAWNTLVVPGSGDARFKLVDPDGVFAERAYDLSISLREWNADLLAGDALRLGLRRCRLLADLTGTAPGPIWEWGLLERVANSLDLMGIGLHDLGRECLVIADAWAAERPDW